MNVGQLAASKQDTSSKSYLDDKAKAALSTLAGSTAFMTSLKDTLASAKTSEEKTAIQGVIHEATKHIASITMNDIKTRALPIAESNLDPKVSSVFYLRNFVIILTTSI